MQFQDINQYSAILEREMNVKIYGHYGTPIVFFPCQNATSSGIADFGMINEISDYIESGKIKAYCVSSIDLDSYSNEGGDNGHRTWLIEQYYRYFFEEFLPLLYEDCGGYIEPILSGFSMGANHATSFFFRRPELFQGLLVFSGVFDNRIFFHDYMDGRLYDNSPWMFIPNMPNNHPYIDIYNSKKIYFVIGQGAWEEGLGSYHYFQNELENKGIHAYFEYWGYDVSHDWPWWKREIRYMLPKIL